MKEETEINEDQNLLIKCIINGLDEYEKSLRHLDFYFQTETIKLLDEYAFSYASTLNDDEKKGKAQNLHQFRKDITFLKILLGHCKRLKNCNPTD